MTAQLGSRSLKEPPPGCQSGCGSFKLVHPSKIKRESIGSAECSYEFFPPLHQRGGAKTWQSSSIHILLGLTQRDENGGYSCDQANSPPQKKKLQKM